MVMAELQAQLGAARLRSPMALVTAELDRTRCRISNLEKRLKGVCAAR